MFKANLDVPRSFGDFLAIEKHSRHILKAFGSDSDDIIFLFTFQIILEHS